MSDAVSVVVPVYNAGRFFRAALDSVASQTHLPAELILVDDYSTDGSMTVAEAFAKSAPFPVHIVRRAKNSGSPVVPMNEGIERAANESIVLLDQDDVMVPERIAVHLRLLRHDDCALAFGQRGRIDEHDVRQERPWYASERFLALPQMLAGECDYWLEPAPFYENVLLQGSVLGASNMALRKSVWQKAGGFDARDRIAWDRDFTLRATRLGRIGWHDTIVCYYRIHGGNFSIGLPCRREVFRQSCQHLARPLWDIDRAALRALIAEEGMDLGYTESETGHPFAAFRCYGQAARAGAGWRKSVLRMAKIVPQRLRARLGGGTA